MKITKLELIQIQPRWLILKMHTDKGIVGLGEPTLEGKTQTLETCVNEMGRWLIGQDPRRIEHIWQTLYRGSFYRGGPVLLSAISGIEQACWDILGKHLNTPIWQLLGGKVRDRIRMYRHVGTDPKVMTQIRQEKQWTMVKTSGIPGVHYIETPAVMDKVVSEIAALREAAGRNIDIGIDFHGRVTPALARRLAQKLEPYDLMFIEEPVLPGDTQALKQIAESTTIPIATGERLFTRWQFQDIINEQACAIVQPDVSHAGGIWETRKIAAMAESRNIALAPHCPLGPVALAACIQVDACSPNFLCQEQVNMGEGYLKQPFVLKDGYVDVPEGPGLGIELDDDAIEAKRWDGAWDVPLLELPDGGRTEW